MRFLISELFPGGPHSNGNFMLRYLVKRTARPNEFQQRRSLIYSLNQLRRGDFQCSRDGRQAAQRGICLATLDAPHVGAVQPAGVREPFLTETLLLAQRPHSLTEPTLNLPIPPACRH
jgi:hypothetical protein